VASDRKAKQAKRQRRKQKEQSTKSPAHDQGVLERLRGVLDAWIVETNDQGRLSEDPSIPASWEARMKQNYDERIRDRDRRQGRAVPTPLP